MFLDAASYIFAALILFTILGVVVTYVFQQVALVGAFWFSPRNVDLETQANDLTRFILNGKAFGEMREMASRCIYDPPYRHTAYPKIIHKLTVWRKDVNRYEESPFVRRAVLRELDRLIEHYKDKQKGLTIEATGRRLQRSTQPAVRDARQAG